MENVNKAGGYDSLIHFIFSIPSADKEPKIQEKIKEKGQASALRNSGECFSVVDTAGSYGAINNHQSS
jgi:hypothetical protein